MSASSAVVGAAAGAAPGGMIAGIGVATETVASSGTGESRRTGTTAVGNESVRIGAIATGTALEDAGLRLVGGRPSEETFET